jgi:hypothetical protein
LPRKKRGGLRRAAMLVLVILGGYGLLAYLVLPGFWTHYEHQRGLADMPMVTRTGQGIPGDPMNVGLIGDLGDVVCAMHAAGWYPADRITLKSSIEIVGSVLLDRPYKDAPVSNLYYLGRREDLAYEKPIGASADRRNHVRYWKVLESGEEKRPVWLGAATEDRGVGVSKYTAAVTHHISPDLDAERALLAAIWKTPAWSRRNIRSPASGRRLRAIMAAATSITPTARSGCCGWSKPARSARGLR